MWLDLCRCWRGSRSRSRCWGSLCLFLRGVMLCKRLFLLWSDLFGLFSSPLGCLPFFDSLLLRGSFLGCSLLSGGFLRSLLSSLPLAPRFWSRSERLEFGTESLSARSFFSCFFLQTAAPGLFSLLDHQLLLKLEVLLGHHNGRRLQRRLLRRCWLIGSRVGNTRRCSRAPRALPRPTMGREATGRHGAEPRPLTAGRH